MSKPKRRNRNGRNKPTCGGKRRFDSPDAAVKTIERRLASGNNPPAGLRSYHCPRCKGWHLTSMLE